MNEIIDWQEESYRETFEEELRGLTRRFQNNPCCAVEELEMVLDGLYIAEGNNWEGRGSAQDTILSATIAAYEYFINQLKTKPTD